MDTFDTLQNDFAYQGSLSTRMACHMGDVPVAALCNILGDQPLFFVDYVDAEDLDTEFMDPMSLMEEFAESEYMPENFEHLRKRMARLESASQHIDAYEKESIETAFDRATSLLGRKTNQFDLDQLMQALQNGRFTNQLLTELQKQNVTIVLNDQIDRAVYDRDQKAIHVNPRMTLSVAVMMSASAMRQAWLQFNGAGIHPLHFAPEEAILLNRIQQADLTCAIIRTAWEMNLAGDKDAWTRIITGSSYDLAVGFARESIADFRSINNGDAAHATFERWFFSGRCKDVDRKLIQSMLSDHHGLVFDHPHVSKMVTADIIARTGDMPTGRNYLTGMVEMILGDPLFTEVRDRSNANFLWFIKFERSFRATEDGEAEIAQILEQSSKDIQEQSPKFGPTSSAEIIAYPGKTRKRKDIKSKSVDNTQATVYYLDHFIGLSNR